MKKINYLALFGVICLNALLFLGVAVTIVALLFSLWVIVVTFILSPILLIIANYTKVQDFSYLQTSASVLLFIVGVSLLPFTRKITYQTKLLFLKYFNWNKQAIYHS